MKSTEKTKKEIKVFNISNLPTDNFENFLELQEDFKISTLDKEEKLEQTILKRGFKYAFIAWKDQDGQKWIIDAHRRKKVLNNLHEKGHSVPPVPYYLIQAKNKKEAVEEIAYLNSEYATKNPDTDLFANFDIDLSGLDIVLPGFEEGFDGILDDLQENSFSSKLNESSDQFSVTFVFDNEHKDLVNGFISTKGKDSIVEAIINHIKEGGDDA